MQSLGSPVSGGIHGTGGVGKSTLAAFLGQQHPMHRVFSHGVFWVTVGVDPDLLRLQAELLHKV